MSEIGKKSRRDRQTAPRKAGTDRAKTSLAMQSGAPAATGGHSTGEGERKPVATTLDGVLTALRRRALGDSAVRWALLAVAGWAAAVSVAPGLVQAHPDRHVTLIVGVLGVLAVLVAMRRLGAAPAHRGPGRPGGRRPPRPQRTAGQRPVLRPRSRRHGSPVAGGRRRRCIRATSRPRPSRSAAIGTFWPWHCDRPGGRGAGRHAQPPGGIAGPPGGRPGSDGPSTPCRGSARQKLGHPIVRGGPEDRRRPAGSPLRAGQGRYPLASLVACPTCPASWPSWTTPRRRQTRRPMRRRATPWPAAQGRRGWRRTWPAAT